MEALAKVSIPITVLGGLQRQKGVSIMEALASFDTDNGIRRATTANRVLAIPEIEKKFQYR